MKKVLLATSALFLTAGVASAELAMSGTAAAGIFKQGETATAAAETDYKVYSGIDIGITASTTTENGMTLSATTDIGSGFTLDAADKELDAQGSTAKATTEIDTPKVTLGYNGVTVALKSEGVDDYYDGDLHNYDIGVSGSFGGLSYGIALETESNTASDYSATIGYTMAGVSLTINQNDVDGAEDERSVSASYTMGAVKATLKNDNKGAAKDVNTLTLAYTAGPAVITVSGKDDKNNNTNKDNKQSWDLSVATFRVAPPPRSYATSASHAEDSSVDALIVYAPVV
jgi:outer membrane protein OmpU